MKVSSNDNTKGRYYHSHEHKNRNYWVLRKCIFSYTHNLYANEILSPLKNLEGASA